MTFSSEYDLLCSELSILVLRVKLWLQSVGLNFIADDLQSTFKVILSRDLESTITQCLGSVLLVLSELKELQRQYEFQPPLLSKSTQTDRSDTRFVCTTLQHRIREHQKQRSCLTIARWTIRDAKRFKEKLKQLKTLIDGLEDISTAAGIVRSPVTSLSGAVVPNDSPPPPYSLRSSQPQCSRPLPEAFSQDIVESPLSSLDCLLPQEPEVAAHYLAMMRHTGLSFRAQEHPRWRAREKMTRLNAAQFKELRTDVYDEMFRRELEGSTPAVLPPDLMYHPRRNQARGKLSTLSSHRFKDLVVDVLFELERRFPSLQGSRSDGISWRLQSTFSEPDQTTSHRHGRVFERSVPPPLLQDRAVHQTSTVSLPLSRFSQSHLVNDGHIPPRPVGEIFKSFRVSHTDPTWKVLPVALRKYRIHAPWQDYSLFVEYGNQERCLGLDELPLQVFKDLDRRGLKPMFMLRKTVSDTDESFIGKAVTSELVL